MKVYSGANFLSEFDHGKQLTLEAMRFDRCIFTNCILSKTTDIARRSTVRDVQLKDCVANGCNIGPALFEDCSVDGLTTNDLLIVWGALFRHVTLSGSIGALKINQMVSPMAPESQRSFDDFRRSYYHNVDWALDISRGIFREFDVRGIPARLFRLDLETQAVVTRERALQSEWEQRVSPWNSLWPFMIRLFVKDGDADMVLVTPLGAPKARREELLKGLKELRNLGVAEPI